ncbi:MAG: substrate-binding domain-containing protein [Kiritimatiellia bacterium]
MVFFGPADSGQRERSYTARLRDKGHEVHIVRNDGSKEALTERLRALPKPCGVSAFNDINAVGLVEAAREAELAVPGDLAVLGVDDDMFATMFSPVGISSVAVDFVRIGYEAAALLDGILRGGTPQAEPARIAPTRIIERESSDYPGRQDGLAVRAARLIRRRACEPVKVPDLVADLPGAYRTMNRCFRKAFGHSMKDEIDRIRIAEAARLLSTTHLPLRLIAERTGYADTNYFNVAFRKRMGVPPGAYRRRKKTPSGRG